MAGTGAIVGVSVATGVAVGASICAVGVTGSTVGNGAAVGSVVSVGGGSVTVGSGVSVGANVGSGDDTTVAGNVAKIVAAGAMPGDVLAGDPRFSAVAMALHKHRPTVPATTYAKMPRRFFMLPSPIRFL